MSVTRAKDENSASITTIGRQAIATEAEALWSLCDVGRAFVAAVKQIQQASGRLLVFGASEYSTLGPKPATTFSATGTPSCILLTDLMDPLVVGLVTIHDFLRHGIA